MWLLSIGLGVLFDVVETHHGNGGGDVLDPLARSLGVTHLSVFFVGVVGAMFITSEYTTTSIRTTLTAVPRRTLLVVSKLVVMLATLCVVCELLVFALFLIGQAIYKGSNHGSFSLNFPGALRGVLLAGLYLVLMSWLGFALGLVLRKTPAAIMVFVTIVLIAPVLLFLLPNGLQNSIDRYMPTHLGEGMMSLNQAGGTFSPYVCTFVLLAYVVGLTAFGTSLMNRRDA